MEEKLKNFGSPRSEKATIASPISRPDTYVVLNLLPASRLEWLRQQSLRVAAVCRQSASLRLQ